jgi:hypothetical protein
MTTPLTSFNISTTTLLAIKEQLYIAQIMAGSRDLPDSNSFTTFETVVYIFMLPFISSIGFFLNLLCALVYWRIVQVNTKILYKFLLVGSIVNSLAMLVDAVAVVALCGHYCTVSKSYFAQAFNLYGFIYLADVFETFNCLIDIVITIDRLLEIRYGVKFFKSHSYKWTSFFLLVVCAVFYIPFVLKKKVIQLPDNKGYSLVMSEFGLNKFWVFFILCQLFLSELFVLVTMIVSNLMLILSLKNHIYVEEKEIEREEENIRIEGMRIASIEMSGCGPSVNVNTCETVDTDEVATACQTTRNESVSENSCGDGTVIDHHREYYKTKNECKVTLMIVCMSLVVFLSNSPTVAVHTIELVLYKLNPVIVNKLNTFSNILIVISYTLYIFIFYYFNKVFRDALNQMISCRFSWWSK